jgi:hypothetical protein
VHTKQYEQHFIEDSNKKSFADSIRIKEGKTFELPPKIGGGRGQRFQQGGSMGSNHRVGTLPPQTDYNRKRDGKFDEKRGGQQQ